MTSIDGDWVCDQDELDGECNAIWQRCPACINVVVPDHIALVSGGGLVPWGQGLEASGQPGNLWCSQAEELEGKFDICPECMGSGGCYIYEKHDA